MSAKYGTPKRERYRETPRSIALFKCDSMDGDYTEDEMQFLKAIDRYKRENRRPAPTWAEVLAIAKSLGWKRKSPG